MKKAKISYILVDRPDSFPSFESFAAALRHVKEVGFEGVEINLAGPNPIDIDALVRTADSIDLPVVSLLSGSNYFSEALCLSSPRDEVRRRAVERLQGYTALAARLGAVLVVGQMQGFLSDEPDRAAGETRIEACMRRVVEAAERNGATIAFEPVNHLQAGFNNTLSEVMALADRIGSDRLRPMLDSFHMNVEERNMTEPIHRAGNRLAHFHLCESNGSFLGSGHLNFKPMFEALEAIRYQGYVSLKIYRQPWAAGAEASVTFLKELLP